MHKDVVLTAYYRAQTRLDFGVATGWRVIGQIALYL